MKITAQYIFSNIGIDIETNGFTNDEFETKDYILMQKPIDRNKNDAKPGFEKVYIEINDQKRSAYGGIKRIIIEPSKVLILLENDTADKLMTSDVVEIFLPEGTQIQPEVVEHLKKMNLEVVVQNSVGVMEESGWE